MADRGPTGTTESPGTYQGSRFSDVRAQLLSDPYTTLPYHKVTIGTMFEAGKNLLLRESKWILQRQEDLVPPFQKLLNPVAICLFGRWRITEETPYTGCLKTGAEHLIIVRCSNQMTTTDRGTRRGFGFAGKIFPTLDPQERVRTVNFIGIDNLSGTFVEHYTDVAFTNEPPFGFVPALLPYALVAANILFVFNIVDQPSNYRPIHQLYEHGLAPGETPRGPKWIQITADPGIGKSDEVDFRDELRPSSYPDGVLRFFVAAAEAVKRKKDRVWRRIGVIELDEGVCSESGDHRLRFHHDRNKGHAPPA